MSLWWLQPEWKQTLCARCGVNIWDSGGDPDWGLCYECKVSKEQEYPEPPSCDVCGEGEAVMTVNNKAVCSKECADKAAEVKEKL